MSIYLGNKKIAGLYRAEDLTHATEEHAGIIELATQDEVNLGEDDLKAVTPKKLDTKLDDYTTKTYVDDLIGDLEALMQDFNDGNGGVV